MTVVGPNDRKGNLVVRLRGKPGSKLKPILIIAHTDVVEAKREDWTTDRSSSSKRMATSTAAASRI